MAALAAEAVALEGGGPPPGVRPRQVAVNRVAEIVDLKRRERASRRRLLFPAVDVEREHGPEHRIVPEGRDVAKQETALLGDLRDA